MKKTNTSKDKLESFVKDHADDLKKAKKAFSQKNWENFCKTMHPLLKKAEDLGLLAKENAEILYNKTKQGTADFYVKASHFAKDAKKLYTDNADVIEKTCNDKAKEFFADLKEISTDVFEDTKIMAQEISDEAHKHGKPFLKKIKNKLKNILNRLCKKL